MAIKYLEGRNIKEILPPETPIWERREVWRSPLVIFVLIGYVIYGISYGIFWAFKWIFFSWISPFSNSLFFCKIGFHKWRYIGTDQSYETYVCKRCIKEKKIERDSGY